MKLPQKSVQEFMNLYKAKYGKELTYDEAEEMGRELLELYSLSQNRPIM